MLQDAASALHLPVETLPTKGGAEPKIGLDYRPFERSMLVRTDAGFTVDMGDARSHLMTFADFALMYVFVWSDVLWPAPGDFPTFEQVLTPAAQRHARRKDFAKEARFLTLFRSALPLVRRLLANIPSLMCMDDHEITDDWNLNLAWVKRTQDPAKLADAQKPTALGCAIIRNGLVAYAVFQAWGNTPEQFKAGTGVDPPGKALLDNTGLWDGSATGTEVTQLATLVGLPTGFLTNVATRPGTALKWHYRHEWASHEVLVLDTRTRRGLKAPAGASPAQMESLAQAPPALIYEPEDFAEMLAQDVPPMELTIVVAAGPVFGVPLHEAVARNLHAPWERASAGVDPEHWALTPYVWEHLLSTLLHAARACQQHHLFVGGDSQWRCAPWFSRARPLPRDEALGVPPVATPFGAGRGSPRAAHVERVKNEDSKTKFIESVGFTTTVEGDYVGLPLVVGTMWVQEVYGWENGTGPKRPVGVKQPRDDPITIEDAPGIYETTHSDTVASSSYYTLTTPPEWHYEVRPQRGIPLGRSAPENLTPTPAGADGFVHRAVEAADKQKDYSTDKRAGQQVVGHNNIGDVEFDWGTGDDKTVIHTLWWRPDEGQLLAAPYTRWTTMLSVGSL